MFLTNIIVQCMIYLYTTSPWNSEPSLHWWNYPPVKISSKGGFSIAMFVYQPSSHSFCWCSSHCCIFGVQTTQIWVEFWTSQDVTDVMQNSGSQHDAKLVVPSCFTMAFFPGRISYSILHNQISKSWKLSTKWPTPLSSLISMWLGKSSLAASLSWYFWIKKG